jgi:uncharacterized protein YqiB (DUF1249 family)
MTGICHYTQLLSVEMKSPELFAWAGPEMNAILFISASQVARITGVSPQPPAITAASTFANTAINK